MVLMRTPGAEADAGVGNVRTLHDCMGEGRSRARKGKTGQKKQPQRGLGVAQLEKLRMQEQNKQQEAALFQSSPHDGGACFRHAIPPHHHRSYGSEGQHRKAAAGHVDEDVFRTLVSLASSTDHFSRAARASVMLPRRKDDTERFFVCHQNKVHGVNNNPGAEAASPARRASYALAFDASPPASSVQQKSPFFSSALVDSGDEKPEAAVESVFSSKEVGVVDAKLRAGAPIVTFTNLQCFKSSLGPVRANCDRPKELSSFQSFLSNQPWSTTPEKPCGWKRPWHALNESTCKLMHSESLDLNAALAGDSVDAPNRVRGVAHDQHVADGAHHSQSIVRSASEDGFKTRMCGMWDENQSAEGVAVGSEESHLKGHLCEPESKRQNRCSSDFPPSSLTLNRRRCLSSPEIPLLTGSDHQKSGDFLTLGLSVSPFVEVDDREAAIPEERCKSKQTDIHAKEAHDILQLQMCNPQQHLRSHFEGFCSEGPGAHVRPLSFRFFPLPSGSVHKLTGTKEDFLDLRLKLAL